MFVRGLWPLAIGLTLLSLVIHGHAWFGLLAIPAAAIYSLIYFGGYKWFPETFLGLNQHVWIEQASGWLLGFCVVFLYQSVVVKASAISASLA